MPDTAMTTHRAHDSGCRARPAAPSPMQSALRVVWTTLRNKTPDLETSLGVEARASRRALESLRRDQLVGAPLNARISVLTAGVPSGPRVILVHGTPGSALGWADYLRNPPPGCEVVALDRPGFGCSAPWGAATDLGAQAAAVAALLPIDGRRAVVLGHSLGGAVAARVAAEHPRQVAALVLIAASLDPELEAIHPLQRIGNWLPLRGLLPRAIRNANQELLALKAELEALAPLLPRISAAVIILHGTNDPLVPVANVAFMQTQLRGARNLRTVLLAGANHFLPWNDVAAVREALHGALEAAS